MKGKQKMMRSMYRSAWAMRPYVVRWLEKREDGNWTQKSKDLLLLSTRSGRVKSASPIELIEALDDSAILAYPMIVAK